MREYNIHGALHCADFIGGDQHITYGFSAEDVERLIDKVLALIQAGGVFLPAHDQSDVLQIEHGDEKLIFRPGAARQLASQSRERAYLLALTIDQEYQRWATRFVPLAGKMDLREVIEDLPISYTELIIPIGDAALHAQITQKPLKNIAEAMHTHGAFIILGEPGAGKTTTQQKIAFDAAREQLKTGQGRLPLFVRLSQQGERDPYTFLQVEWERRTGIPFGQALKDGHILILADGINEIPREKRNESLHAWMLFEQQYRGGNQLIFSGRVQDYDNQLNLPRVLVEPFDQERVHEFLRRHKAEALAELIDDPSTRLAEMARNPLNLFVLVMVYLRGGRNLQTLTNRGKLFQSFARELMAREQLWHPDLLSIDAKADLFARLAYEMQKQGVGTTFEFGIAKNFLPKEAIVRGETLLIDANSLFRFGRGASILDPATLPDIRFYHHLLQEYFAANDFLRRFNRGEDLSAFWKTPRTKDEMPPVDVGPWDPLPEPPTTGWEVTTVLACGLSNEPTPLIEAIRQHNPALAARCLDEAGISPLLEGERQGEGLMEARSKVQQELLADLYNPALHLRARLQAGFVLGRIGDPRFEPQEINGLMVILPKMVNVPAGNYQVGSKRSLNEPYADVISPPVWVELQAFALGKWPVTNAEFLCFMNAGGYENQDYWQGELAKRWLQGEEVAGGQIQALMDIWKYFRENPGWQDAMQARWPPEKIKTWEEYIGLDAEQVKAKFAERVKKKSRRWPHYWNDRIYNNPSQPVVGITWFEARAYCAWLSKVSRQEYRLPSEAQWEAAASGHTDVIGWQREYPWGDTWDPVQANTVEGRVQRPSPVGAYAAAAVGPFGAEDQAGNVWEWTSSLYRPYQIEEGEHPEADSKHVARGGSWLSPHHNVSCAYRYSLRCDGYGSDLGFRILSPTIRTNSGP